jgi:hypothetical protein
MRYNEAFRFLMGTITVLLFPIEKLRIKVCSMRNDKLSEPYPAWPENEWLRIQALINPIKAGAYISLPFLLLDKDDKKVIDLECLRLHVNMDGKFAFDKETNIAWADMVTSHAALAMRMTTKDMKAIKAQAAVIHEVHADVIWEKLQELLMDAQVDEGHKLTRGERRIQALLAKPRPKPKVEANPSPPKGDWDGIQDI